MSNSDLLIKLNITCPACTKYGQIKIKENIVETSTRGITAIMVAEGLICEHSFIAYIDNNLVVRDCFICDFAIELPQIDMETDQPFLLSEDYDVSIIKLNILPSLMVNVLRGIFLGKQIALISNDEFISENILGFFKHITIDSFNFDLRCIKRTEYINNKKQYKEYLVLDHKFIINDKDNFIYEKDLKIEKAIVQKFFAEFNPKVSVILIKNQITKIYLLVQALIDFNKNFSKKHPFTMKQALDFFEIEFKTPIQTPFLEFLEIIASKRFKIELYRTDKITDFLGIL